MLNCYSGTPKKKRNVQKTILNDLNMEKYQPKMMLSCTTKERDTGNRDSGKVQQVKEEK